MQLPALEGLAVQQIYAVNSDLRVYEALREAMAVPKEINLWHGTSWHCVEKILKQGFNRSYAGRHGALLGHASYFSTDPKYSLRFCDRKGGGSDRTKAPAFDIQTGSSRL